MPALDTERIRSEFPILQTPIHGDKKLVYLDNAASTQHPQCVIDAMSECYRSSYANVHRGIHALSELSTHLYEKSRKTLARFVNAASDREIIFTSGTTAGVNLVAHAWGNANVGAGDEILLTEMEHHSNIVPWQQLAERRDAKIRFIPVQDDFRLDLQRASEMIGPRTRMLAVTAVSNVLGTINPIPELVQLARNAGAQVLVDAAQHVPHAATDVQAWDADFIVFSGHKMCGPSGVGVLYGKYDLLEAMPAFLGGGSMISRVTTEGYLPGFVPSRFEAGTPPIVEAIGLMAAVEYLEQIGIDNILQHEQQLAEQATRQLQDQIQGIRILRPTSGDTAGVISFVVDGFSPQDIALLVDRHGVAVRAGHHCAMPLHDRFELNSSLRASFYLYNQPSDVERLADALQLALAKLKL